MENWFYFILKAFSRVIWTCRLNKVKTLVYIETYSHLSVSYITCDNIYNIRISLSANRRCLRCPRKIIQWKLYHPNPSYTEELISTYNLVTVCPLWGTTGESGEETTTRSMIQRVGLDTKSYSVVIITIETVYTERTACKAMILLSVCSVW